MINGQDFNNIMTAMVPLYFAMFLAYASIKWWKIFTPDQCAGINRFVAIYLVPFLSFQFISKNNPYTMNFRFLAADTLQKIIVLFLLILWVKFTKTGSFEWLITLFSLSTLPNTLVIGIPFLKAMYGNFAADLMVQVVALQVIFWYTLLIFLFELRGARMLIMEHFPESGGNIVSIKVDSDVVSLDGQDVLETSADVGDDGKLHVTVRKSNVSRRSLEVGSLSGAEIYSLRSSVIQTPRPSNFDQSGFYSIMGFPGGRLSNFGPARVSNFEGDTASIYLNKSSSRSGLYHAAQNVTKSLSSGSTKDQRQPQKSKLQKNSWLNKSDQDAQMFARSTSAPIASKGGHTNLRARAEQHDTKEIRRFPQNGKIGELEVFVSEPGGDNKIIKHGYDSGAENHPNMVETMTDGNTKQFPSATVMIRLILRMVLRKVLRNPSTYASVIGISWSLVSFRLQVEMPKIIANSISLISDGGLGMAMFSVGLFMALQPKLIACGASKAMLAMIVKFLIGPFVIVITSLIVGIRGTLLQVSIVQASLSVAIVPFVFAKEYNVHPTILSTSLIFGMLITVPITLCYYIVLELLI
uniref:Auxin efflux carrier component n=1 Tax=Tanacetum cinerariifolium TaxID=118510 RepID=A0A699J6G8_TANCI|nr:putative auxin efflux carrier [Tanacetum cinerariifolium]